MRRLPQIECEVTFKFKEKHTPPKKHLGNTTKLSSERLFRKCSSPASTTSTLWRARLNLHGAVLTAEPKGQLRVQIFRNSSFQKSLGLVIPVGAFYCKNDVVYWSHVSFFQSFKQYCVFLKWNLCCSWCFCFIYLCCILFFAALCCQMSMFAPPHDRKKWHSTFFSERPSALPLFKSQNGAVRGLIEMWVLDGLGI